MNREEFMAWFVANFGAWASSSNTTKLQWLSSLERFADQEFNREYNIIYPPKAKE